MPAAAVMIPWALDDRAICALLMAACALLLGRWPRARAAWTILIVVGMANALVLNLLPQNVVTINFAHHYLGAKYPVPYPGLYRAVHAALDRPQFDMRDLDHPPGRWRDDPRQQRAYLIDMMRARGVAFNTLAPADSLLARARASGAIHVEADSILHAYLPDDRVQDFRRDVRAVVSRIHGRDLTDDYGFNGSPFYALVRQADPTLHMPFSPVAAVLNLLWQTLAVFALAWLVGGALALDTTGRMAVAALLLASWDVVGWLLPGLVFAGVWIPLAVSLHAMRRGRQALAGGALAWASLIKLFPAILLLLPLSQRRWRMLAAFAGAAAALGAASVLAQRSWIEFVRKVVIQFEAGGYLLNSVSLNQGLFALGIRQSWLPGVMPFAVLAVIVVLVWRDRDCAMKVWPRRSLVILSMLAWVSRTWFNYYAIAPLLLLPLVGRTRPRGAALAAVALALSFLLPEFDHPLILAHPVLHLLKLAPYIVIPVWLLGLEFRGARVPRRAVATAAVILGLLVAAEAARAAFARHIAARGEARLDRGDGARALVDFDWQIRLAPRDGVARMNRGIALALAGREEESGESFARAVALDPESIEAHRNYARWLRREGRLDEAVAQLEAAVAAAPWDDGVRVDLARVLVQQGRGPEATVQFIRALELAPGNREAHEGLMRSATPER